VCRPEATLSSADLGWLPQWQGASGAVESSRDRGTYPLAYPTAVAGMAIVAGAVAAGADSGGLHARRGGRWPTPRFLPGRWRDASRRRRSGDARVTSGACRTRRGRSGRARNSSPSGVHIFPRRCDRLRRAASRRTPGTGTDFAHRAHRCADLSTDHPARAVPARPAQHLLKL
jgi:hypothetical protein